jgi:DNA-binding PadR family transcriptional regulator
MARNSLLSRGEEIVLAAVAALGSEGQAYGVSIYDRARELTNGKYVSLGSIYTTLARLEHDGFVESWSSDDRTPERGNRAKRCFRITGLGRRALAEVAALSSNLNEAWGWS